MHDLLDNPEIAVASKVRGGRSRQHGRILFLPTFKLHPIPVRPALRTAGAFLFSRWQSLQLDPCARDVHGRAITAGPTCHHPRRPACPAGLRIV